MRKLTFALLLFTLSLFPYMLSAQSALSVSSKTAPVAKYASTDWVAMMRDHNVNIHDVKNAFHDWYKKTHGEYKPGAGDEEGDENYEAYKRWEWYNMPRADRSGNRADPYQVASDYDSYLRRSSRSMVHSALSTAAWTYAGNTAVPTGGGGDGRVNRVRIMPGNNSVMFACSPEGGLWKTTNGGTSWSENTDQLGDLSTSDIAINPLKTTIMYLATGDGDGIQSIYPTPATIGILKSYDGGATWTATSLAYSLSVSGADFYSVNEILIDPQDTSVVLAATTFGIWRSANSGATWTLATGTGTGNATWFHSMEFEPGHPSVVYAGSSNVYNYLGTPIGANFYRSVDNGNSWTQVTSGLPSNTAAQGFEIGVSAADSNDVYVLACNSTDYGYLGLYLSTNHGVSFTTQSTTPDILGWEANGGNDGGQGWYTLSMAVSQTNIDSVWVGGVNIWASSNGGTSWHLNANWEGTPYVHADIHAIQFIPGTNSKGYVVGCDGGVFITSNSGTSWTDISNNLEIAQQYCVGPSATTAGAWITGWQDNGTNFSTTPWSQVYGGDGMDCFIDWSNNNNLYAETPDGGLARSTNNGGTWNGATNGINNTELNDAPWVTIWLQDPRTSTTLYSGFCNVWKSTNSGGNWSQLSTWGPISDTNIITALAVDSSNVNYIYAAQHNIIEVTTNGGTNWTNITGTLPVGTTNISAVAIDSKSPTHVWVTFAGYSAGNQVFASKNAGATWTNISAGLPNLPVNCIVAESGSAEGIYIGTDEGVYYHDTILNNWIFYNAGLPNVMVADLKIFRPGKELIAATYGRGTWETPLFSPCAISSVTAGVTSNVTCNGEADGSASSSASGGTAPYTYIWTSGSTTSAASGLSAGTYTLVVVDNAGCYATASVIITQPTAVGVSIASQTDVSCFNGSNGSAIANPASGGNSPYTYLWSGGGGTNLAATGLSAGTYIITATDNNGCTGTVSAVITQPASSIVLNITSQINISCNGGNNGSAVATASGGTSPYIYSWNGGITNDTASNLAAGSYTITATDFNGCSATTSAIITQPVPIAISADSINATTGNCDGSAWAIVNGGTAPYSYLWTGGLTTDTISNQCTNNYCCTVTDANGCMDSVCITISVGTGLGNLNSNSGNISIYPNPNNGVFTIETSQANGETLLEIYDVLGQKIMNSELTNKTNEINLSTKASGVYFYRLITNDGSLIGKGKIVIQK